MVSADADGALSNPAVPIKKPAKDKGTHTHTQITPAGHGDVPPPPTIDHLSLSYQSEQEGGLARAREHARLSEGGAAKRGEEVTL